MRHPSSARAVPILLSVALLVSACGALRGPDVIVTFTDGGCTFRGPRDDVPNPIVIRVENPTEDDYALVIAVLKEAATQVDLEAWHEEGTPPFLERMLAHLDPGPGKEAEWTVDLTQGRENYFVCAEPAGVLAVPAVFVPAE